MASHQLQIETYLQFEEYAGTNKVEICQLLRFNRTCCVVWVFRKRSNTRIVICILWKLQNEFEIPIFTNKNLFPGIEIGNQMWNSPYSTVCSSEAANNQLILILPHPQLCWPIDSSYCFWMLNSPKKWAYGKFDRSFTVNQLDKIVNFANSITDQFK